MRRETGPKQRGLNHSTTKGNPPPSTTHNTVSQQGGTGGTININPGAAPS